LSLLKPRELAWLWPGRLAEGTLAMFDGDPGRGKSLVTLDLCARVSTGRAMPEGTAAAEPANVIVIQSEDSVDATVLPRLKALGANLGRVFIFRQEYLDRCGPFSVPRHLKTLKSALAQSGARLVVIDPIVAFLDPDLHAHRDQDIRRALMPLEELAEQRRFVALLVRHLNKKGSEQALYRGAGSIGFTAVSRSAWLFAPDPDDAGRLVMAQEKNNYARPQRSLSYRIKEQEGSPPVVEWLGECAWGADELLARAGRKPILAEAQDRAADFLRAQLKLGACTSRELAEAAQEQGLSLRTLQLVRPKLGIKSVRVWNGQATVSYWLVRGQKLPESIPPEHRPDDLEDLWAPLREKYPVDPLADDE
jgi:hypothetical protein